MPTKRRTARRRRELTIERWNELLVGPRDPAGSCFGSQEELAGTWSEYRNHFLALSSPGRRPYAWYIVEAKLPEAPDFQELWLADHALLSEEEETAILERAAEFPYVDGLQRAATSITQRRAGENVVAPGPLDAYL